MKIQVLFFAASRDLAGTAEAQYELPDGDDVAALLRRVVQDHPQLGASKQAARFARNEEFVDEATRLRDGDRVAWLPPMSGG